MSPLRICSNIDRVGLRRADGLADVVANLHAQPAPGGDDLTEIFSNLGGIDVDSPNQLKALSLHDLTTDGGADGTEADENDTYGH